jgi:hypothetical protein
MPLWLLTQTVENRRGTDALFNPSLSGQSAGGMIFNLALFGSHF